MFLPAAAIHETEIVQEKRSSLIISDADSDVLFDEQRKELSASEYADLKLLALKSARDFLMFYQAIPDKDKSCLPVRETFYGQIPRTAFEMYEHTKNVNDYYFGEIGVVRIHAKAMYRMAVKMFGSDVVPNIFQFAI